MHQVDARVRAALANAEITRNRVRIVEQLDPDVWKSVSRTLTLLGGKFQVGCSAFAFASDPRPKVDTAISTGAVRTAAGEDGYVPTPAKWAEKLTSSPYSDVARMPAGSQVLEPSFGDGPIVQAVLAANDEVNVTAVEPNPQRARSLGEHGGRVTVVESTFEQYAAGVGKGKEFDAVVMNPPFSVAGNRNIWLDHVITAWRMLCPGGRLVSVVPASFRWGMNTAHEDLRALVNEFGGWQHLPDDTFGRRGFRTCVLWLVRPIPGQESRPSHLFRHYPDAVEPVRVAYPWLTGRAVAQAPVQVWHDRAWNRDRVLRYRAQCWRCGWLLWEFDQDNDMSLGKHSACTSLYAVEDDKAGLTVGLCLTCRNDGPSREAALKVAREVWDRAPSKAAPVPVWSLLLRRGGMVPVDALERDRHARVQATLRVVFGVDEHAPEADLIDARQARPWHGGPDALAATYLRAYADRLDPHSDLDEADRAALLWRSDPDVPAIKLPEDPDPWGAVLDQIERNLHTP